MQPSNIIKLHSFEVSAMLVGSGLCRVEYRDGNLIIPVGSPEEAFAFLARLAPPATAPAPAPADHIDQTVDKLRAVADALDAGSLSVPEAVANAQKAVSAANGANGHASHAPPVEEPKKADKKPKADKKKDPDAKPRNVTDDVADQEKVAAAEPPKEPAAAAKETAPAPAAPEEASDTEGGATELDEAYITSASKMRDIVVHMYEKGVKTVDGILAECAARKDHPVIGKAAMSAERVERMLLAVGIELPGAGA